MEVTITNENFASLKGGNLPLVVDFWDMVWPLPYGGSHYIRTG